MDMDILPKERLALSKDLIATVTIVNVKRDMYIVVDMGKEDMVRIEPILFFFLLIKTWTIFSLQNYLIYKKYCSNKTALTIAVK